LRLTKDASTNGQRSTGGLWGRRLLGLAFFVLVAVMAAAVPRGTAAESPYLNVWVHYDYMVGADGSFAPSNAAIQMVVDAFRAHGVTLHIDPQHTAIPERTVIVPDWPSEYASTPGFDDPSCTGPDAVRFSDLKTQYFHPNSNHPWHYAVFGDFVFGDTAAHLLTCPPTQENDNTPPHYGMTGDAQVGFDFGSVPFGLAYDFVVTTGAWKAEGLSVPDRFEASYFMHELGHNLGLRHGGPPDPTNIDPATLANNKPNYLSVMNYDFTGGIPYAVTPGSTEIVGYRIDYSDTALPTLYEGSLDETLGVQDAAHPTDITYSNAEGFCATPIPAFGPVDWNGDGNTTDTQVTSDLNCDLNNGESLTGGDDWGWLCKRLTPPSITSIDNAGDVFVTIVGVNLMLPATVTFSGGATSSVDGYQWGDDRGVTTQLYAFIPAGAKNGPITITTPEGKATSSQTLTITP